MPEGEINVYTVRDEDYKLSGVRVATQEEYDARTREEGSILYTFGDDMEVEYIAGNARRKKTP